MTAKGGSFALRLQLLPNAREKVLSVASLVGARNGNGRFTPGEVAATFDDMAIPAPGNISSVLARLRDEALALQGPGRGQWRLTPKGRQAISGVMASLDPTALEVGAAAFAGAEFAHVAQTVIPHWAAPPKWQMGINRLLERFPFETNVFCMTRFASEGGEPDPVTSAITVVRDVLDRYGLTVHLASDRLIEDDLLGNVGAYMWACNYGLGILENRIDRGLNQNAVIELGGMIVTGRRCALLKDRTAPALPTDLAGQVYKSVDLDDLATVEDQTDKWASEDLGLSRVK